MTSSLAFVISRLHAIREQVLTSSTFEYENHVLPMGSVLESLFVKVWNSSTEKAALTSVFEASVLRHCCEQLGIVPFISTSKSAVYKKTLQ